MTSSSVLYPSDLLEFVVFAKSFVSFFVLLLLKAIIALDDDDDGGGGGRFANVAVATAMMGAAFSSNVSLIAEADIGTAVGTKLFWEVTFDSAKDVDG